jgi:NAD(P)-dependent dehydrogenase (short-subunit alcohol dehydrogenase family)
MAEACARAGADIAIWGTNADKNAAAEVRLKETGRHVVALRCDIGDEQQVIDSFAATVEQLGKVDALFANSGIGGLANFTDMSLDEWRRIMRVNLDGTFLTLREAARHMVGRGEGGALVAVSSVSAIDGAARMVHYGASKGALTSLMRGLAVELARHKIRCNSLLPGWIDTDMNALGKSNEKFMTATTTRTPLRRWGTPEDMGPTAVFLANPEFIFHTGQCLVLDGGYTIF